MNGEAGFPLCPIKHDLVDQYRPWIFVAMHTYERVRTLADGSSASK